MSESNSFRPVHMPGNLMDDFLRLARENTVKNLETCGVLAGASEDGVFHISMLIIPKQTSTSNSAGFQKNVPNVVTTSSGYPDSPYRSFPFHNASAKNGIHLCFQKMLTEAIAIVMAPTDKSSPKGIFRLSDPGGVTVIGKCQETGFRSHLRALLPR
ncbi:AMSH-like ubiquitin thioesterase 3 [Linum perenne]